MTRPDQLIVLQPTDIDPHEIGGMLNMHVGRRTAMGIMTTPVFAHAHPETTDTATPRSMKNTYTTRQTIPPYDFPTM